LTLICVVVVVVVVSFVEVRALKWSVGLLTWYCTVCRYVQKVGTYGSVLQGGRGAYTNIFRARCATNTNLFCFYKGFELPELPELLVLSITEHDWNLKKTEDLLFI
jgi:hypothetical protein